MTLAAMERYSTQQARMQGLAGQMHHNLAATTDLDGLDRLLDALTRVLFHNESIGVVSAAKAAFEAKKQHALDRAEEQRAAEVRQEDADLEAEARERGDVAMVRLTPHARPELTHEGPPLPAFEQAEAALAAAAAAELEGKQEEPNEAGPAAAAPPPAADPEEKRDTLVVKQKPPVSKVGRKRGFRFDGK